MLTTNNVDIIENVNHFLNSFKINNATAFYQTAIPNEKYLLIIFQLSNGIIQKKSKYQNCGV